MADGPPGGAGDGVSATSTSGAPPVGTTGSDDVTDDGPDVDDDGSVFLPYPDVELPPFECDLFAQDCPPGEKCMPWANDGGPAWNATRCSPLDPDPGQVGEACMVEGSGVSGIDDCDLGLMCWSVDADGIGICEDMCTGTARMPICENPADVCSIANDGAIVLCLPTCDPVAPVCPAGDVCYRINEVWACAPAATAADGVYGEPCEVGECVPGHTCVGPSAFTMCAGAVGCCTSFCDLNDDGADAMCAALDPAQACEPFYAGVAPEGYEHVGICTLPP